MIKNISPTFKTIDIFKQRFIPIHPYNVVRAATVLMESNKTTLGHVIPPITVQHREILFKQYRYKVICYRGIKNVLNQFNRVTLEMRFFFQQILGCIVINNGKYMIHNGHSKVNYWAP